MVGLTYKHIVVGLTTWETRFYVGGIELREWLNRLAPPELRNPFLPFKVQPLMLPRLREMMLTISLPSGYLFDIMSYNQKGNCKETECFENRLAVKRCLESLDCSFLPPHGLLIKGGAPFAPFDTGTYSFTLSPDIFVIPHLNLITGSYRKIYKLIDKEEESGFYLYPIPRGEIAVQLQRSSQLLALWAVENTENLNKLYALQAPPLPELEPKLGKSLEKLLLDLRSL